MFLASIRRGAAYDGAPQSSAYIGRPGRLSGQPAGWREQVAAWIGRIVTVAAVWSLVSIPFRGHRWADLVDDAFGWFNVPAGSSLFVVVLMFITGSALRRRLRAALWAVLIFQLVNVVLEFVVLGLALANWNQIPTDNLDLTRSEAVMVGLLAGLGCGLVVLVWLVRSAFPARLAQGARISSLAVLIAGLAASVVVTFGLTEAFPNKLSSTAERVGWAIRSAFGISTNATTPGFHGHHGHHWIASLAGLMSAAALLAAAGVFLRSARAKQYLAAQDELNVRRLILEGGERDSLAYFATRRDKSVTFSPDGRAALTYRVVASVSLVSADPIGHVGSWPAAIEAWLAEARGHGWFPAVLSASEQGASAYVSAGLKALAIGDEAIIDVDSFTLEGRTMRPVRQAVTRIRRAGYTVQACRHGDLAAGELTDLARLAEAWRGDETERGFSMALSRLGDPADSRCVMVTAHDAEGTVRGLLSFVPWGARGLSLDLMRRDRAAENGLTEFMVAGLVEAAADLGVRRISLNFAMFRSVFSAAERVGAGPVLRLTEAVLSMASRFWQLETLYRSNAKYLPSWVPRFMCYDSSLTLTRAAIASGMAEGFIPAPKPVSRRHGPEIVRTDTGEQTEFSLAVAEQQQRLLRPTRPIHAMGEQQRVRRTKIDRLSAEGMAAYPVYVPRSSTAAEILDRHAALAADMLTEDWVSVAGRVRALRDLGGVSFAVLSDEGVSLQVMLTTADTAKDARLLWKQTVDLGDQVSVTGPVATSRTGELSILVDEWTMAAKCLRPLPDVHAGFSDPDARVRQRYLDLIVNGDSMAILQARSCAVKALRDAFADRGFTEVETPMLQAVHGGATARPFRTHINAYNADLYLRIAPELYLKRLCVGGMGKIFELNRNFRNEGADATHNPEFTSVEAYQAYADYTDMRELTRELIIEVATAVNGSPVARRTGPDGTVVDVDLGGSWNAVSVHDEVSKACGTSLTSTTPLDEVQAVCVEHHVHAPGDATAGELVLQLYEELVEKQTVEPTFYCDFPLETSPLTRTHRSDPLLSERWDLVAFGTEIATAYSELVDPIDQRARLTDQSIKAAAGDPEAMQLDESFLTALEYAMPPTGGLGLGVDRLVMMLTGTDIRATLAFPFVRPQPHG
ncbi:MAG: bifunctional lysylphosphatidylglycerol synthetase/lysine--tRNA ligase LysX [Actinomycetota bacterium]